MNYLKTKFKLFKLASKGLGRILDKLTAVEEKLLRKTVSLIQQDPKLFREELSKLPKIVIPVATYSVTEPLPVKHQLIDKKNLN